MLCFARQQSAIPKMTDIEYLHINQVLTVAGGYSVVDMWCFWVVRTDFYKECLDEPVVCLIKSVNIGYGFKNL